MSEAQPVVSDAPETVKVTACEGRISVRAPCLFVSPDDATVRSLIERLFQTPLVRAVSINRQQTTVDIQYDQTVMDRKTALLTVSRALSAADQPREDSLIRQYLSRVPGQVTRAERRLPEAPQFFAEAADHLPAGLLVAENLIVEYEPQPTAALTANRAEGKLPSDVTKPWVGEFVVGGVRRIVNLTAAGGCLVMSIVGVVTPGIPTVPFVLATGYFLARSSPRLHERFRRSPFFGRMITDYEDRGGLRWTTKFKTIALTVGLMVVTVVIAGASLPLLFFVAIMGGLGIYMVSRIPTIVVASP